ncbi:MAG: hypothetical protein DMD91_24210 [Candidatus Rokuibacteriota bacterium]|nr:MAG: hypothetical protein DMD91_24210 [Candidatus Rokubacteria bacterium]
MTAPTLSAPHDTDLLCYCTLLTVGELRAACERGHWPLRDKIRSGKLCTGCVGDLFYLLKRFGGVRTDADGPRPAE